MPGCSTVMPSLAESQVEAEPPLELTEDGRREAWERLCGPRLRDRRLAPERRNLLCGLVASSGRDDGNGSLIGLANNR